MATSEHELPITQELSESVPPERSSGRRRRPGRRGVLFGGATLVLAGAASFLVFSGDSGDDDGVPAAGASETPAGNRTDARPSTTVATTTTTEMPTTTTTMPVTTTTIELSTGTVPPGWQVYDEEGGVYRDPLPEELAFAQTPCDQLYADGEPIELLAGKYCIDVSGQLVPVTTDVWYCTPDQETALWQDDFGWGKYGIESHQWEPGEHLTAADVAACVGSEMLADPPVRNPQA